MTNRNRSLGTQVPGVRLKAIDLKGTREAVPAYVVHRTSDDAVLGYVLHGAETKSTWDTLWASNGPKFRSTFGHRTRDAAIRQVVTDTEGATR